MSSILRDQYFKLKPIFVFSPRLCSCWDVITVVSEVGKFTIRDAILFHKVLYI